MKIITLTIFVSCMLAYVIASVIYDKRIVEIKEQMKLSDSAFHFKDSVHDANLMQIVKYLKSKENK